MAQKYTSHALTNSCSNPEVTVGRRQAGSWVEPQREWLGLKELSNYADICERTLRSWIYSRIDPLPAAKVSGKVLVRRSDFDAYLQRHRIKTLPHVDVEGIVRDVLGGREDGH